MVCIIYQDKAKIAVDMTERLRSSQTTITRLIHKQRYETVRYSFLEEVGLDIHRIVRCKIKCSFFQILLINKINKVIADFDIKIVRIKACPFYPLFCSLIFL